MHPDLAGRDRKKVEDLKAALADEAARSEALTILRSPIEAIVLHPVDKSYELALVGEMAGMVEAALGAGNEKAAPGRAALGAEDRRSVKLVAGGTQLPIPTFVAGGDLTPPFDASAVLQRRLRIISGALGALRTPDLRFII